MIWRVVNDSLLVGRYGVAAAATTQAAQSTKRRKIAAFDFVRLIGYAVLTDNESVALTLSVVGLDAGHVCVWETIRP